MPGRFVTALAFAAAITLMAACGDDSAPKGADSSAPTGAVAATATPANGPVQATIEEIALTSDRDMAVAVGGGKTAQPDPTKLAATFNRATDAGLLVRLSPSAGRADRGAWVDVAIRGEGSPTSHRAFVAKTGAWSNDFLARSLPPGDYEMIATVVGASSGKSLKFTISGTRTTGLKFGDAILLPNFVAIRNG